MTFNKFRKIFLTSAASAILFVSGASADSIVTANRADRSISIIDVETDTVVDTVDMPSNGEPMYVVYSPAMARVFVGDRENDQVVVFDAEDFSVENTVPAGEGVFHMWGSSALAQLWVNNDVDNTITVIDTITLEVIDTINAPADLVGAGFKLHDIVVDQTAPFVYATMLKGASNGHVVKIDAQTLSVVDTTEVGVDPHVSLSRRGNLLYVPSQGSNAVFVLDRDTLATVASPAVPAAHGAGMTRHGRVFYTTNISGGEIAAIDTNSNAVIGSPVLTPFPVPHNIALTPNSKKIYVTHSGPAADKVSVFAVDGKDAAPVFLTSVTVGLNPFGLTFVP